MPFQYSFFFAPLEISLGLPWNITSPSVTLIRPRSILERVVLPLPDSPTMETISPSRKSKSTWSTATVFLSPIPKILVTPLPVKHSALFLSLILIHLPNLSYRHQATILTFSVAFLTGYLKYGNLHCHTGG